MLNDDALQTQGDDLAREVMVGHGAVWGVGYASSEKQEFLDDIAVFL